MQTHTLSMIVQHGMFHEEDIAILWSLLFMFFYVVIIIIRYNHSNKGNYAWTTRRVCLRKESWKYCNELIRVQSMTENN